MRASYFRLCARSALRGRWGLAVLVSFAASLLGVTTLFAGSGCSSVVGSVISLIGTLRTKFDSSDYKLGSYVDPEIYRWLFTAVAAFMLVVAGVALLFALSYFIVSGACRLGYAAFNLKLVDGDDPDFPVLFSRFNRLGSSIAAEILIWLYTLLWYLLFIIPGTIKTYSYSMTAFILADDPELSVNEAITRSRHLMDGNKWRLFCLNFSFIGWKLLCCVPLLLGGVFFVLAVSAALSVVGISATVLMVISLLMFLLSPLALLAGHLFITPYRSAAHAAFYRQICAEKARYTPDSYVF